MNRFMAKLRAASQNQVWKLRLTATFEINVACHSDWLMPSPLDSLLPLPVARVFQMDELLLGEGL